MTPSTHSIFLCVHILVVLRPGTRSMFWRHFVVGCNGTVGCNGDRGRDKRLTPPQCDKCAIIHDG
jgi:hypothetical protein